MRTVISAFPARPRFQIQLNVHLAQNLYISKSCFSRVIGRKKREQVETFSKKENGRFRCSGHCRNCRDFISVFFQY